MGRDPAEVGTQPGKIDSGHQKVAEGGVVKAVFDPVFLHAGEEVALVFSGSAHLWSELLDQGDQQIPFESGGLCKCIKGRELVYPCVAPRGKNRNFDFTRRRDG